MSATETPIVIECDGAELIGMMHVPAEIKTRGVVAIVAGGPQYRGGVGRLQVQLARQLAAAGTPVLRFDYRGLGDSEGTFRGFQDVEPDLRAAIDAFLSRVPQMKEVVLWGGCDAAAAIMINAWKYPAVTGLMVGNPWVHTEETGDAVTVKHHYAKRIRDKDFWLKLLRGQYNPFPALLTIGRALWARARKRLSAHKASAGGPAQRDERHLPFVTRMRLGMSRFGGDVLLLMSGRSLVSKEFDELVGSDASWQQAMATPRHLARHDMPDADQTYSSVASRREVIAIARQWLHDPHASLNASQTQE
ncbi:hydrolase 1, exosortase A system-associated [Nitrogeniibacter mangrovi]|uniref:Hydrolase 1, exosortase A system-associated n=1 Tax=Nitrogeniibacter mangrovi TaxID=2016596 RepID=A0A6C1B720_9RHOO|nr:hydrolase 1, exosortase A system-associated [Nitrogeniibacter mangrovi]QID18528.1 hydrolase 1, exosortase A system-associated [Nitrogeniibacter mangrovi]